MKRNIFISFCLLSVMLSCKSSQHQDTQFQNISEMALKKLGDDSKCEKNSNETFILCSNIIDSSIAEQPLRFFVAELATGEIIHEDIIPKGEVKWISESTIQIKEIPGLIKEGESLNDHTYIFDVVKRRPINH